MKAFMTFFSIPAFIALILLSLTSPLALASSFQPGEPYFNVFSQNYGEEVSLVDDKAIVAGMVNGELFIDLPELIRFKTEADLNLSFGLYYSSQNSNLHTVGYAWKHTYEIYVQYAYNSGSPTLNLVDCRERSLPFALSAGIWISTPSYGCNLTAVVQGVPSSPTGFTVSDKWGRVLSFDSAGLLVSVSDYFGRTTTLSYSSGLVSTITDPFGSALSLSYTSGLLTSIQDNTLAGSPLYISLAYDASSRLTAINYGLTSGTVATYSYTYQGFSLLLSTHTNPDSYTYTFSFNAGILSAITDPLNATVSFFPNANSVSVTDRTGYVWTYVIDPTVQALTSLDYPIMGGVTYSMSQGFDSARNMTSQTNPGESVWTMTYDSEGNILSRSTTYTWNSITEVISHSWSYNTANLCDVYTDPNGNSWHFEWYGPGRLNSIIQPDDNPLAPTHMATLTYDANGFPFIYVDFNGNFWTYAYSGGNLLSSTSPLGNTFTRYYDNRGNLSQSVSPESNTTSYLYNTRYQLVSITKPFDATGSSITSFNVSPMGEITSWTDPDLATYTIARDGIGRISTLFDPLTNAKTYTYDGEGRLTGYSDFRGNNWSITRDQWGRKNLETDPATNAKTWLYNFAPTTVTEIDRSSVTVIKTFDPAGRLRCITDALANNILYEVDPAGNVTGITDQRNNLTSRDYDELNRLVSQTDPQSFVSTITYDHNSNITSKTNQLGGTTSFTFDADNRMTTIILPDTTQSSQIYDRDGNIIEFTNYFGGVMVLSYNTGGYLVERRDPSGEIVNYTYDYSGRVLSSTDSISSNFIHTRDAKGRITATLYPDTSTENYGWDADDNLVSYSDNNGNLWTYTYDDISNLVSIINPTSGVSSLSYDFEGRILYRGDSSGASYYWGYDSRGLLATYGPIGVNMAFTYDAAGNLITQTDAQSNAWSFAYDSRNKRISKTDPLSNTTTYSYDGAGNVLTVTDPLSNTTTYAYDTMGRKTSMTDALTNVETYTYSGWNIASKTDRNGFSTTYGYNSSGALNTISFTDPFNTANTLTRNYQLDTRLRIIGETGPYLSLDRIFDSRDRVTGESWTPVGYPTSLNVTTGYDFNGNITSIQDFSGRSVSYTYDTLDNCTSITDGGLTTTLQFDAGGRIARRILPSGQYETWSFVTGDNIVSTKALYDSSGNLQDQLDYTYDPMGNILSVVSSRGWTTSYTYDSDYRIVTDNRTGLNPYTRTYIYDGAGNMTSSILNGTTTTNTYNALNSLTSEVTGGTPTTYSYDNNGNLVADSNGNSYVYEHNDCLAGYANSSGQTFQYLVTESKARICKQTSFRGTPQSTDYYFFHDGNVINEYNLSTLGSASLTRSYSFNSTLGLNALTIPAGMGTPGYYPYILDVEGNVSLVTDGSQIIRNLYEYSSFGTLTNSGGSAPVFNNFMYKGIQYDTESSQYNAFSRMYDPHMKRYSGAMGLNGSPYENYTFAENRATIVSPVSSGNSEEITNLWSEYAPEVSLINPLPKLDLQLAPILSSSSIQWSYVPTLQVEDHFSLGFRSIGNLPANNLEVTGDQYKWINANLSLMDYFGRPLDFGAPIRPLSVDDDEFDILNPNPFPKSWSYF